MFSAVIVGLECTLIGVCIIVNKFTGDKCYNVGCEIPGVGVIVYSISILGSRCKVAVNVWEL